MKYFELFHLVNQDYLDGKVERSEVLEVFSKLAPRSEEAERRFMIQELMETSYEFTN